MSQKRGVLLASFLVTESDEQIQTEVEFIVNNIQITNNIIFLLEEKENPQKKILTYNAITEPGKPFLGSILCGSIAKKKRIRCIPLTPSTKQSLLNTMVKWASTLS